MSPSPSAMPALPLILIVDDSRENVKILSEILTPQCETRFALSAEVALECLRKQNLPDLILMDVLMPGTDGFELCTKVKDNPLWADIPIIFVTALESPSDEQRGFEVGAVDFITKPFRAQQVLSRVRAQLSLASKNKAMARARDEAAERERNLGDFLANLCHEIRTPLNGIMGLTLLIEGGDVDEEALHQLRRIESAGRHIGELLNNVLDLSKIQADKMPIAREAFYLRETVQGVLDMVWVAAQDKGLLLECVIDNDVPDQIVGDALRLRQILVNFLNNAIKFTDKGRVLLRCRHSLSSSSDVHISLQFDIEDTGKGIEPQVLDRLFQPFVQDHGHASQGTGLGLVISQRLCNLLGGSLRMSSIVSQGTSVRIKLPFERPALSLDVVEDISYERHYKAHVLVADDARINAVVIGKLLEKLGCTFEWVANGVEALRLLEKQSEEYDLLLLDLEMPLIDGYQVVQTVRQDWALGIPIVVLSGTEDQEHRQFTLKLGVNGYVAKPISKESLIEILDGILRD